MSLYVEEWWPDSVVTEMIIYHIEDYGSQVDSFYYHLVNYDARVAGASSVPARFQISAYPNPFNTSTQIAFDLPKAGSVKLKIFDLLGRETRTLVDEVRTQGHHSILFDGSNLPSGIYLYRLEMGSVHEAKKMVLLK
jgi:Tol biopolymer transport system component